MVFNIINVEKMNSVLFNDSTIVRSAQSGVTTYNNNTGVANYNDKSEKYHYRNLSEDEKFNQHGRYHWWDILNSSMLTVVS